MTYLPGQALVPCAVCGQEINRRGEGGQGHKKYCSPRCSAKGKKENDYRRRGHKARPDMHLCPHCLTNPKVIRPDGRFRGWCGPCEAAQKAEYNRSLAGKRTVMRYAERHRRYKLPSVMPCYWCGAPVLRRGYYGCGRKNYCSNGCLTAGKLHQSALRKAAGRITINGTPS